MESLIGLFEREWLVTKKSTVEFINNILTPFWTVILFLPTLGAAIGGVDGVPYGVFFIPGVHVMSAFVLGRAGAYPVFVDKLTGEQENLFALPVRRLDIVLVKCTGTAFRTLVTGLLIAAIGVFIGIVPTLHTLTSCLISALLVSVISTAALIALASVVRNPEHFGFALNGFTTPILYSSTIYYPMSAVRSWLRPLARVNPLSVACDLARSTGSGWARPLLILAVLLVVSVALAARYYPNSIEVR